MGLVVMSSTPRLVESPVSQCPSKWSPPIILRLLLDQTAQIHAPVEPVGLCPGITVVALVVEGLGHCHCLLAAHPKKSRGHLLKLYRRERQGLTSLGWHLLDLGGFRKLGSETSLVQNDHGGSVE